MAELRYTDLETGEEQAVDVSGWQFVIDCDGHTVMRCDLVHLVLIVERRRHHESRVSLIAPPGTPVMAPPGQSVVDVAFETA